MLRDFQSQIHQLKQSRLELKDHEYYEEVIGLLAVGLKGDAVSVNLLSKKDMIPILADIFNHETPNNTIYTYLLSAITSICNQNQQKE